MSYYHLFKRTVKSKKGKPAKKWYSCPPSLCVYMIPQRISFDQPQLSACKFYSRNFYPESKIYLKFFIISFQKKNSLLYLLYDKVWKISARIRKKVHSLHRLDSRNHVGRSRYGNAHPADYGKNNRCWDRFL